MYKSLLSEYEERQRALMLENAELKKVLQQMKKEMVSILSPRKPSRGALAEDSLEQVNTLCCSTGGHAGMNPFAFMIWLLWDRSQAHSDKEDETAWDSSREPLDQSCEHAREQLTNSIRQQWRRLKSHMERLDSQGTTPLHSLLLQQRGLH